MPSDRTKSNRPNLMMQFSIRNMPANASKNVISRAEFVENYPKFLIAITVQNEPTTRMIMASERLGSDGVDDAVDFLGVDICFKDLSLAVKVGDKSVNVVDHITGRVRAKTMTALMGGSGAGKLCLSCACLLICKFQRELTKAKPTFDR
jgi:ABC-type multidrug transport system fused ATPase/permease subunit